MSEQSFEGVLATWGYPGDQLTKEACEDIAQQSIGMVIDNKVWHGWPDKWHIVRIGREDHGDGRGRVIAICEDSEQQEEEEKARGPFKESHGLPDQ